MALTDVWLKANNGKLREKTEEVADRDAMSVRLSPKGKITYQLRYRIHGKQQRIDIGSYPLMSLKDARAESQRLRAILEAGNDPKAAKMKSEVVVLEDTISSLFDKWYKSYCIENKKSHAQVKRSFELHVFPKIGNNPVNQVSVQDWLVILENKVKESESIAARILINAKQMLKWAVKRELITRNVLFDINPMSDLQVKKNVTNRVLSHEELKLLWLAINKSRMTYKNKIFIKLCLIYGCRNGELRLAEKSHFDFEKMIWSVPPENHKMGESTQKPLLRPITKDTELLIKEAMSLSEGKYLFSNDGSKEVMGRSAPVQLPYNIMQYLRRHNGYEMEHWSIHDLRRTARTNFSALTEPHIAEIMLGHKLLGQWQVYDKYDYLDEQKQAYEKWFNKLMTIVS